MKLRAFIFALLCAALATGTLHAQDWAKEKLNKSPRHSEWVDLKHDGRTVKAFVVYPEVKTKAPAVLVIHEIFGLTDWAKCLADEIAAAGYIAIAPDLLTEPGKDTSSYPDQDAAIKAVSALKSDRVFPDLDAAADYVTKLPAANGALAVTGFCWGGGWSFGYANHNPKLKAAYVFYGPGPESKEDAAKIKCPVYGFYAEDDARIGATIPKTTEIMKSLGKTYEPVTYAGAGHGFMRAGEAPDAKPANAKARDDAWTRWKTLLGKL
ncbi:MAG: dienelactone hydrolase family protein [Verrucomicrobiota bacterium]|nr:dienelactone hydrolase family protein [Verrucomicrobiota bacterium]